ncbi:MAG: helix-turn-helix transcriptional regulator [Lachnospiraceae bacterium]|jgi:transcriptional regulator with XRE-family HTH domain|nr:helix-turn-helix transcriptional regulator [Lachnospiraceae bacterium]
MIKLSAVIAQIGITQKELAKRFGVTPQTISNWVNGVSEPSGSQLQELSRLSGIDAMDILCAKTQI